jgi:hypothetical protein
MWLEELRLVGVEQREGLAKCLLLLLRELAPRTLVARRTERRHIRYPVHHHDDVLEPARRLLCPLTVGVVAREQHAPRELQRGRQPLAPALEDAELARQVEAVRVH